MYFTKFCSWTRLFLIGCCLPLFVGAEEEIVDEITVTGDYRGRVAAEIPNSLTILEANDISALAVQHFEELLGRLPNVNWSGDGHRARYLQIRGVGELAQYQGAPNPSVGFVIDDIDFSGLGTIATLFDIDRIEVFRGSQGMRYGANALAGLVYMQSADPTDEFMGKLQVTVGGDDARGGGIALGGPIGANGAGYRVSAHRFESNGFRSNPYLKRKDTNGRNETSIRSRVTWRSGDKWKFKLTGMLSDADNGYDAFAIDNSLTVLSDRPGKDAQRSLGGSLNVEWDASNIFSITSIASIADSEIDFSFDADWGNDDAWAPITYDYVSLNERERKTLTGEIRFISKDAGRIFNDTTDWLLGLYINDLTENLETINQGDYFDPAFNWADTLDTRVDSDFSAVSGAIFGQLELQMTNVNKLIVGTRIEGRAVNYADTNGLDLGPKESMVGGHLAYIHRFSDDVTGFINFSRGFKGGGFNLGFVPNGRREYEAETMWNAEIGLKTRLLNDSLYVNAALFYSLRKDQQVETSFQIDPNDPASFVFFTDNAAEGRNLGFETDLSWFPSEAIEIYVNLGLLNATFDEFITSQVDASGREQAHAPSYTFSLGAVYRDNSGWFGRLDVTGKDRFYFDVSHDQVSHPYSVVNARVGYATDRWTAKLWLQNALDEPYQVRGFYFGNEPPLFPPTLYIRQGDPRHFGMTVDLNF